MCLCTYSMCNFQKLYYFTLVHLCSSIRIRKYLYMYHYVIYIVYRIDNSRPTVNHTNIHTHIYRMLLLIALSQEQTRKSTISL